MREIGFTSKVFTPQFDRRPALRRRTAGRCDRARHLQAGGPDRARRADDGAVADRDRQGFPLRAPGAGERPLDPVHRPQHPSRLRHCRPLRRARSRRVALETTKAEIASAEELIELHGRRSAVRRTWPPGELSVMTRGLENDRHGTDGTSTPSERPPAAAVRVLQPRAARVARRLCR